MPYSMTKAARMAGVSKTTMHKWITKTGKVSANKNEDGSYSIDESEMRRLLDSLKRPLPAKNAKHAAKAVVDEDDDDDDFNIFADYEPAQKDAGKDVLELGVYKHDTLQEVQHKADKYVAEQEKRLLQVEVKRLQEALARSEQAAAKAQERADNAWDKYDEAMQRVTRLLEDKRDTAPKRPRKRRPRKRWLGLF